MSLRCPTSRSRCIQNNSRMDNPTWRSFLHWTFRHCLLSPRRPMNSAAQVHDHPETLLRPPSFQEGTPDVCLSLFHSYSCLGTLSIWAGTWQRMKKRRYERRSSGLPLLRSIPKVRSSLNCPTDPHRMLQKTFPMSTSSTLAVLLGHGIDWVDSSPCSLPHQPPYFFLLHFLHPKGNRIHSLSHWMICSCTASGIDSMDGGRPSGLGWTISWHI